MGSLLSQAGEPRWAAAATEAGRVASTESWVDTLVRGTGATMIYRDSTVVVSVDRIDTPHDPPRSFGHLLR